MHSLILNNFETFGCLRIYSFLGSINRVQESLKFVQKVTAGNRENPYCLGEVLMEILYFDAIIIGLAQRMPCKIRAVRQTSDNNCTVSGHAIIEDAKTDRLPNGDYDVQIEGRQFAFKRKDGKFSPRQ